MADLNARTSHGKRPMDFADNDEMRQTIINEEKRRRDHGFKRSVISPNSTNVIHETIAARAYEMWEEHGKPDGEADAHWLAAEREQVTGHQESEPVKPLPVSF